MRKAFIWDFDRDNLIDTKFLIDGFKENKIPLFINTQCPENLEEFENIFPDCNMKNLSHFEMELCPSSTGKNMFIDSMPHAWSMITAMTGIGQLESIEVTFANMKLCKVQGIYKHAQGSCEFHVKLSNKTEQPRPFNYTINGNRVDRVIDTSDYSMIFKTDKGIYPIEDPLEKRIKKVLSYLKNKKYVPSIQEETLSRIHHEMELLVKTIEAA